MTVEKVMESEERKRIVRKLNQLGLSESKFEMPGTVLAISLSEKGSETNEHVINALIKQGILAKNIVNTSVTPTFSSDKGHLVLSIDDINLQALDRAVENIQMGKTEIESPPDRSGKKPEAKIHEAVVRVAKLEAMYPSQKGDITNAVQHDLVTVGSSPELMEQLERQRAIEKAARYKQ